MVTITELFLVILTVTCFQWPLNVCLLYGLRSDCCTYFAKQHAISFIFSETWSISVGDSTAQSWSLKHKSSDYWNVPSRYYCNNGNIEIKYLNSYTFYIPIFAKSKSNCNFSINIFTHSEPTFVAVTNNSGRRKDLSRWAT